MGAAQQKDAAAYFTQALTGATRPDTPAFLAKARQYEQQLCGGSEWSGVALPVAVALLEATTAATTTTASTAASSSAPPSSVVGPRRAQLRWLLRLCTSVLRGVAENPNETIDPSTPAVLHLTELLLRHVLRLTKGRSAVLVAILESGRQEEEEEEEAEKRAKAAQVAASSSNDVSLKEDAAAQLCESCFAVLIQVPLSLQTVATQLEVFRLLLTMTSSALHHSTEFREDTIDLFTELMMSSPQLSAFLDTLLKIVVSWGKSDWTTQAPLLYHEGCQPSMRSFFQVFGGGGGGGSGGATSGSKQHNVPYVLEVETSIVSTTANAGNASNDGSGVGGRRESLDASGIAGSRSSASTVSVLKDPAAVLRGSCSFSQQLGHHAAALLCVLIVHQKGSGRNPALEYIAATQDGVPVTYIGLLSAIRWKITRYPELSVLLYVLLHDHHEFLHTILSEDAALLVSTMQQVLELTYKTCKDVSRPAPAGAASKPAEDVLQRAVLGRLVYHLRTFSYPFINFMSSTLLLLASQDCVVNRLICNTPCLPGHLLERYDVNAPVGALAIVVLALGITKGFNERNEALIAVFAPCLVNVAPFVHDIDPYTSQRVSSLLTLVLKKMHRAGALLKMTAAANNDTTAATTTANGSAESSELRRSPSGSRVSAVAAAASEEAEAAAQALEEILAMYLRQLRTIVEGVEALLRGPSRHNEHLIYELLYSRSRLIDEVEAAVAAGSPFAAPAKQLLANLTEMIKNCEADIASSDQAQSTQEIIAILRRGQRQGGGVVDGGDAADGGSHNSDTNRQNNGSSSRAVEMTSAPANTNATGDGAAVSTTASNGSMSRSPGPDGSNASEGASVDLVYSYEESPHSYDFFGPFVWSVLLSAACEPGAALWCHCSSELALFPH